MTPVKGRADVRFVSLRDVRPIKPDVYVTPAWQVLSSKGTFLSFQFDWRLNTSSDRHVSFKDRANLFLFRNAWSGGQGLGNTLVFFYDASSTHKINKLD